MLLGRVMRINTVLCYRLVFRTGELVGLKWEDIDFSKKTMNIQRSMEYRHSTGEWRVGEPKSKSGYRVVPLTDEAISILKRPEN